MRSKYSTVFIIIFLLLALSFAISTINYTVSLNSAQKQLKDQSLPLSLDNIYTEIQKHIIEPYLVSSMMANDTFVQDWLLHEEQQSSERIVRYLEAIKNKYGMFNTFLVSENSKSYYTQKGFIENVREDNPTNSWYFDFKNIEAKHEINLDFNEHLSNNLIMFINYKIFDRDYHFLGATGVALKISYIDDMLKNFRQKHNFIVTFYDSHGNIVLSERQLFPAKHIDERSELSQFKELILSKKSNLIEYSKNDEQHIINTKYIEELDLYLAVDANLQTVTESVRKIYMVNLFFSLLVTAIVAAVVFYIIRNYSSKLEYLSQYDSLTKIYNRRFFEEAFNNQILLHKRNQLPLTLMFFDIDDFKNINDNLGHNTGDIVLEKLAKIFKDHIRKTDLFARWGGEEFILAFIDADIEKSIEITQKLKELLESNMELKKLTGLSVTASFGLTELKDDDSIDEIISRADEAMYKSKHGGKNRVTTL